MEVRKESPIDQVIGNANTTRTPHTPATGDTFTLVPSGSHETRVALMEAYIMDLKDQIYSLHTDMWIDFEKIKALLTSHSTDFTIL